MLVPKRFEKPSKDGSQNQTMELETELENRVHPLFGFEEPYSNRFWNPNNLLGISSEKEMQGNISLTGYGCTTTANRKGVTIDKQTTF